MAAIFISHSSRDAAVTSAVSAWLVAQGHQSLFLDFDPEFGIPAGRSWEQELYQQLRACRAVIVLCSRASMASKWCFAEITQARSLGKVLLPVRIDDCTVDSVLASQQVIDLGEDREEAFARMHRGLLAAGVDPKEMFDWDSSRAPYPGLLAFQEQDAAVYFGRGKEVGAGLDLLNRVRRLGSPRVVVVVGASGSGKSSLVRAGLVPRLRRDAERWLVVDPFRPRDDPVAELSAVWSHAFGGVGESRDRGEVSAVLRDAIEDPTHANPLVTMSGELRRAGSRSEAMVLLVVDQFEELLDPTSRDAPGVLRWLRVAAEASGGPLIVLATLRSDFLGAFQKNPGLAELAIELMPVGPMSVDDVTQVIEGPASVAGLELGSGLVQAMLSDSDTEDGLPLLAFTLREMYDHFGADGRLDAEEYRSLGGLHGALVRVAEELVESEHLTSEHEDLLRRAFLAMARLTDDDRWVRQVTRWDQLPSSIHPVLERFVSARLLVSSGDTAARTVEVAHEALFRSWDRLAGWLQRDAEAFRLRRDLENAAEAWVAGGQQPTDLWRGARLERADELTRSGDLHLSPTDQHFIDAALEAREAEFAEQERARRRKLRIAAVVTAGALLLAGTATVFFVQARRESDRATRQANRSAALALAAQANDVASQNPALGLVLAAEAARTTTTPLPQATTALFDARTAFADRHSQQIGEPLEHADGVIGVAFSPDGELLASGSLDTTVRLWDPATGRAVGEPLQGDFEFVHGVAFSPDGTLLASAAGTGRLWDPATGQPVGDPLQGHTDLVNGVAFSPDGSLLASASDDTTVRLWDPATGLPVGDPLQGHTDAVFAVAFSPDGALLASASDDTTVRLWDPATGLPVGEPLQGHTDTVRGVAFSPDGTLLASASIDSTVRLWDPATGLPAGDPLEGHTGAVFGVAFSPDGTVLASASDDRTVRLWDPATGQPVGQPLRGHTDRVEGVAFSPDGGLLASASWDMTVRLWDPAAGQPVSQPLQGHTDSVYGVAYSPDGTLLASASVDSTVRLWDPATGQPVGQPLQGHTNTVFGVVFSPDGTLLASASADWTVRLWDPATGRPVGQPLEGHTDAVRGVAFSPDGTLLASASWDGTVRLWDSATGQPVGQPLQGHTVSVYGVAFSPDGRLLASAGSDGTVRLWDPATGQAVGQPLQGHIIPLTVSAVAFSPDGTLLASASWDRTVQLWDPATGQSVGEPLQGHTDAVDAVAFSPDGTLLASASTDQTVRLWDPATGQPVGQPLQGHNDTASAVAFSPDGRFLASGGNDRTVRLWDGVWDIDRACALAEPYVTAAQLRPYLPPGQEPAACDP